MQWCGSFEMGNMVTCSIKSCLGCFLVCNTLVNNYSLLEKLTDAEFMFVEMSKKDLISFNTMMSFYVDMTLTPWSSSSSALFERAGARAGAGGECESKGKEENQNC